MQVPPPVNELLDRLNTMVNNVRSVEAKNDLNWTWRPTESNWSLNEVVCHLRDVEREVHQWRFHALVDSENAFIPGVSADEWAQERHYRQQDGPNALDEFIEVRSKTITLLQSFSSAMWERQGRHAFFGPTSMHELLYIVVRHDALHWTQIQELLTGWEIECGAVKR
jgi:hypothetical protein